jgi:hypothetical protein
VRMKKPRDDAYGSEKGIRLEFALRSMVLIFGGLIFLYSLLVPAFVAAHPGGLAADGCHNDRKNGGRHCHRANAQPTKPKSQPSGTYYVNCAAARATGAAPVRRGDPGYGNHLDRDNDGVGCE